MGTIGKDFDYKIIKNFLAEDERLLLKEYCVIRHRLYLKDPFQYLDTIQTTWFHGDAIMDALLVTKLKLIEKEINKKLLPCYSFWRVYTQSDVLTEHKDRPACEISLSVRIDGDSEWPIYFDGHQADLKNGDAVVYLGAKLRHWRGELEGDHQSQVFLHYVDADGPHKDHVLDGRQALGIELR